MNPIGQNVHFITLSTPDLQAARDFYVRGLGWEPLLDVPGEIVFFQIAPGTVLGLFEAVKFQQDLGLDREAAAGPSGLTLAHNVGSRAEVRSVVAAMEEAGGQVLTRPEDGAFGGIFHAHVRDPNGVIWEIAHNPGWRVAQDGAVVFGDLPPDDSVS
ncbi:VOC family protein [Zhihengliuella sp.]|uniref:VOC family protein n=1 Tax=Zhihengliuella sp. TaxID=1954483 RepID=UPI00281189A2|nr:VOC family protein [Zhihengliuella sp.]